MENRMTLYVVRSMTTTDFDIRSGRPVTPYHIYLLPPELRHGAYWSGTYRAMTFDSPQDAEAEANRCLSNPNNANIVPLDDHDIPTYWELRDLARARHNV